MTPARVLLVEDEPAIAELIAVNLRHHGPGLFRVAGLVVEVLADPVFQSLGLAYVDVGPLPVHHQVNLSLGGTSIIIMVGVALETVKQLESQMMMRHYKGFLD